MIIFWFVAKSFKEYLKLMRQGKLGQPHRPVRCSGCKGKSCFWKHGEYLRRVEEGDESEEIAIQRFKCQWCGKTVSMLPSFVIPKRRYSMRVIACGVEDYATNPTTYRNAVVALGASGPSPSQLFGWLAVVLARINVLVLDVQGRCVDAAVSDEALEKGELAECPNAEKAAIPGKGLKLHGLSKLVAYGRLLHDQAPNVMLRLGMYFLGNVEQMQQIFANEVL